MKDTINVWPIVTITSHVPSASAESKQDRFCLQLFWAGVNFICLLSRSASGEIEQKIMGERHRPLRSQKQTAPTVRLSSLPSSSESKQPFPICSLSAGEYHHRAGKTQMCDQAHARINLTRQTTTNKYHQNKKGGIELIWPSALKSCWPSLLQTFDVSDMLAQYPRILVTFSACCSNTKINFAQQGGHYRD